MHEMRQNFLKCGMTGWCMEVIFTGLHSIAKHDPKMMGQTSILMFPIYGAAALLGPISRLLKKHSILFRGLIYTCCIFTTEYVSGSILKKKNVSLGLQRRQMEHQRSDPSGLRPSLVHGRPDL